VAGAAGAYVASSAAKGLADIANGVDSATGSQLIGNLAAKVVAGLGGEPPTASASGVLINGAEQAAKAVPGTAGYVPDIATLAKGDGAPPPNLSPDGAGRSGAFNEAKRNAGVPVSQQPVEVRPNVDRQGNVQPGYQYVYEVPAEGGKTKEVIIRDDAGGHFFGKDDPQNRGAHFNDPAGNHYDY
jgi:filamentous hemagglutinin